MSRNTGKLAFAALAVIIFLAFMYLISGGVVDVVALSSIPIVVSAEAIILGMMYATIFHGEPEETAPASSIARLTERSNAASLLKVQHLISSPSQMVKS